MQAIEPGENFNNEGGLRKIKVDPHVRCAYEPCNREIPDGSSARQWRKLYCSDSCMMFGAISDPDGLIVMPSLSYTFVTVEYKSDKLSPLKQALFDSFRIAF